MQIVNKIEKVTSQLTRIISLIGLVGLLSLASATVIDILLRWLFNSPIFGLNDLYSLFMSIIIASCFPLCIYNRSNITIRFLGNFLGERPKAILDVFGAIITLIIFFILGWQFWLYTNRLSQYGDKTWILNWHISPWTRVVTLIIFICVPVATVTTIQYIKSCRKRNI